MCEWSGGRGCLGGAQGFWGGGEWGLLGGNGVGLVGGLLDYTLVYHTGMWGGAGVGGDGGTVGGPRGDRGEGIQKGG